jgi:hypothetical protein
MIRQSAAVILPPAAEATPHPPRGSWCRMDGVRAALSWGEVIGLFMAMVLGMGIGQLAGEVTRTTLERSANSSIRADLALSVMAVAMASAPAIWMRLQSHRQWRSMVVFALASSVVPIALRHLGAVGGRSAITVDHIACQTAMVVSFTFTPLRTLHRATYGP